MKKLLKRLLNNKGLTLTELIVALFLTSVILAIAVGMLAPVKDLMNTMKSNAHMDTISSTVDEYLRGTLQTATSLKLIRLDENNQIGSGDTDDVKKFCTPERKAKAIAVLNVNPDSSEPPIYRLFDFDALGQDYTQLINHMTWAQTGTLEQMGKAKEYVVFNEPFYEGTSCAVEFYNDGGGKRLQLASQCFRNGESINQKHVLSFNLLNTGVSGFTGVAGDTGEYTNVDIEAQSEIAGHCYLLLYTTLDI